MFSNRLLRNIRWRHRFKSTLIQKKQLSKGSKFLLFSGAAIGASIGGVFLYNDVNPIYSIRIAKSIYTILKITALYKYNLYNVDPSSDNYNVLLSSTHKQVANILLNLFQEQGGLYIKLGQYLASQNQSLPPEYQMLRVLQDRVKFRDISELEDTFIEDFGKPPTQIFKYFDTTPIAAASIAQVHKAIRHDGKEVAVKVQYPEIQRRFSADMLTYRISLFIIEKAFKNLKLLWISDGIESALRQELDFIQEGKNAEKAFRNFDRNDDYYIPKVYWDQTTKRILTTEFITGYKIDNLKPLESQGITKKEVAEKIINCIADQIFLKGFFHGDPHPGNILIRMHPTKANQCQVVLLDHGLYKEVSEEFRINCCKLYKHLLYSEYKEFERICNTMGIKDWKKMAFMILLRPIDNSMFEEFDMNELKDYHKNPEIRKKIDNLMMSHIDEWNNLFDALPRDFVILFRNSDLVRSVNRDLGIPVNRFSIYAKKSMKGLYNNTRLGFFHRIWEALKFKYMLKKNEILFWVESILIKILHITGFLPKSVTQEGIGDKFFEDLPLQT